MARILMLLTLITLTSAIPAEARHYHMHYGRGPRGGYGAPNTPYYPSSNYSGFQDHTPVLQVRSYSWPSSSPADINRPEPVAPVELLAKQERLVIDDKHPAGR